jgi:hypothetical protein
LKGTIAVTSYTQRQFGVASLCALSLSLVPIYNYADTVQTPFQDFKSTSSNGVAIKNSDAPFSTAKSAPMDTVVVDTQRPVIPLAAVKTLDMSNMSLSEAKEALGTLMQAQEKMMSQMQTLQARIEKTETQTAQNQQAIEATNEKQESQGGVLQSLSHRVNLTGYVEHGWRTYTHGPRTEEYLDNPNKSGSSFDIRRVVLRPRVNFTDKASWYGEAEFEDAFHEVIIEESVFNYAYKPWLNAKSGLMTLPYTYTAVNHDGPLRLLVDRPLLDQYVIPSTYNDLGVGLTGLLPVGKQGGVNYEFDVVNGLTDTFADPGNSGKVSSSIDYNGLRDIRPGEGISNEHFRDNNSNKMLFGRIGYSPFPALRMAVSGSTGKLDHNNQVALNVMAGDMQYRFKKFSFLGEYAKAFINNNKSGVSSQGVPFRLFPSGLSGYFMQAAYDITPKLTAIGAFSRVNLDESASGNTMNRISAGMRYNPFGNVYLKTEYQYSTGRERFGNAEHASNALLTQLTFSFL